MTDFTETQNQNQTQQDKTLKYGFDEDGRQLMVVNRFDPPEEFVLEPPINEDLPRFEMEQEEEEENLEDQVFGWYEEYDLYRTDSGLGLNEEDMSVVRLQPEAPTADSETTEYSLTPTELLPINDSPPEYEFQITMLDNFDRFLDHLTWTDNGNDEEIAETDLMTTFYTVFGHHFHLTGGRANTNGFVAYVLQPRSCINESFTTFVYDMFDMEDVNNCRVLLVRFFNREPMSDEELRSGYQMLRCSSILQLTDYYATHMSSLFCQNTLEDDEKLIFTRPKPTAHNAPSGRVFLDPQDDLDPNTTAEAGDSTEVLSAGGVDLVENRGSQEATPMEPTSPPIPYLGSQLEPTTFPDLTARWNKLSTISWSTSQAAGTMLGTIHLPYEIFKTLGENPATLPLLQYTFCVPNITLRLQLNSTPFHSGLVIVGVQYYSAADSQKEGVRVPDQQAQIWPLDSGILNAAASNTLEINIPFQSFLDMIPIRNGIAGSGAYYCSVYLAVVSPLRIGENGTTSVTISTQVKLECKGIPTTFFGQQSREVIYAQDLFGLLNGVLDTVEAGTGLVRSVIRPVERLFTGLGQKHKASNMDRPILPIEANPVINFPTGSLSNGDGIFQGRSLRLNPATTSPHPLTVVPSNGTILDYHSIAQVKGYVASFSVKVGDSVNTLLWSSPVTPYLCAGNVQKNIVPTPIAGCTNMYSYWSGSLIFTFIVVKANPHSLRLRFSTSPTHAVTGDQMVNLPSVIQDFEEITTIDYVVPYMAPSPLCPTFTDNHAVGAGVVQVRLESQLISTNATSNEIDVIVLLRAGPDFQLAVPRPLFMSPILSENDDTDGVVIAAQGLYAQSFAETSLPGTFTNTEELAEDTEYLLKAHGSTGDNCLLLRTSSDDTAIAIPDTTLFDPDLPYVFVCNDEIRCVDNLTKTVITPDPAKTKSGGNGVTVTVGNKAGFGYYANEYDSGVASYDSGLRFEAIPSTVLNPQDNRTDIVNEQGPSPTPASSITAVTNGEDYPLRTTLRRFQTFYRSSPSFTNAGLSVLKFDLNYGYHTQRVVGNSVFVDNLTFCHDAFRFGKGSLRFNMVFERVSAGCKVRVFHIPPGISTNIITRPTWKNLSEFELLQMSMFAHEYVCTPRTTVPFEVPYNSFVKCLVNGYNPNVVGLASSSAYSFGTLAIVLDHGANFSCSLTLERALGDDADLYVFQGWPKLEDVTEIININNQLTTDPINHLTNRMLLKPQDMYIPPPTTPAPPPDCEFKASETELRQLDSLAGLVESFRGSRRGRKTICKYFSRFSKHIINPQDLSNVRKDKLLATLAEAYLANCEISADVFLCIPGILDGLTSEQIKMLIGKADSEDLPVRKVLLTSLATRIYKVAPQTTYDYFSATGTPSEGKFFKNLKTVTSNLSALIPESFKNYVRNIDNNLGNIPSSLISCVTACVSALSKVVTSREVLFWLVSNVQMLMYASDFWVKGMAFVALMSGMGFLKSSSSFNIAFVIVELMFKLTPARNGYVYLYPQDGEQDQEPVTRELVASYAAALLGGVCATAGLVDAKSWPDGIKAFTKNLASGTNSWFVLLSKSCTFVTDYIMYLIGIEKPEALALAELKAAKVDGEKWMKRVLYLTDPARRDEVISSPALRAEVADHYEQGALIVRSLADSSGHTKVGVVMSIWKSLCSLYSETGDVPTSIKANRTPILIWLYGAPGVGKSELTKTLACQIATLLGISCVGDPFFVRKPRKYWDGYHGQPIVIIDDALQATSPEFVGQFMEDWFGLMTPAPFSPEFSRVDEKSRFVCPEIVICASNQLFPRPAGVADVMAFQRRRDFLFEVIFSPELIEKGITSPQDTRLDLDTLKNFDHLRLKQYPRVTDLAPKPGGAAYVTQEVKPNPPETLSKTLKNMLPHLKHLREIRYKSAENQISLSNSLDPMTIEKARKDLVEKIGATDIIKDVVASVTGSVTEIAPDLAQVTVAEPQDEAIVKRVEFNLTRKIHEGLKPVEVAVKNNGLCTTSCKKLPCVSFAELTLQTKENEGKLLDVDIRLCDECNRFVVYERKVNYGSALKGKLVKQPAAVLGDCSCCLTDDLNVGFNTAVTNSRLYNEKVAPGFKYQYPPLRETESVFEEQPAVDVGDFWTWFKSKSEDVWSLWSGINWRYLLALSLAVGIGYILQCFDLFTTLKNILCPYGRSDDQQDGIRKSVLTPLPQMASSGSVTSRTLARRVVKLPSKVEVQGTVDDLVPRIRRNQVKATVIYSDGVMAGTWGLGLWERFIVFPHHTFIRKSCGVEKIDLQLCGVSGPAGSITLDATDVSIVRINNTDLCLMQIENRRIPCFRNLTKSLLPGSRLGGVSNNAVLVNVLKLGKESLPAINYLATEMVEMRASYALESGHQEVDLLGFSYPLEGDGMCGSVLIDRRSGLITGIHTAGAGGKGYATLLCSDYFANFDTSLDVDEPVLKEGGSVQPRGDFVPIGLIPEDRVVTLPLRTQIAKSDCFGVLGDAVRSPVKMIEKGEPIPGNTNLTLAVEKGGSPSLTWPIDDIKEVKEYLKGEILSTCKPLLAVSAVRSVEEAIVGIPDLDFAEALRRDTSVGWPLSTMKLGSSKNHFIDYSLAVDGLHVNSIRKEAVEIYSLTRSQRKRNMIPFSPYMNFLKDERLKSGKKPRLINGCPLDQVIEFRRYCMDFCSATQSAGSKLGIMIGMNVHGPQWSSFANELLSMGDRFLCGDYSGFGPGLDPELVLCCGEIVNAWYDEYAENTQEDRTVRRTLFENLAFSHEVSRDTCIQTLCGSPSGNPYTALINSMVNLMYLMLAWKETFRGTVLEHVSNFRKHVKVGVYGDDLIATVAPEVIEEFNNETLQRVFASKGIKYTDADKSGNIRKWTSLAQASFLKCSFVEHPTRGQGFYLAGLEKPMIEDIPNWIRAGSPSTQEASLANCVEAARLAYAWGFEYFDQICSKLRKHWMDQGVNFTVETWDYLDKLFFGELRGVALPKSKDPLNYAWA